MDYENHPEELTADQLLDEILGSEDIQPDISPNIPESPEAAVALDPELERIIQETLNTPAPETPASPEPMQETMAFTGSFELGPQDSFKDDEFRDTFGEGEVLEQVFSDEPMPVLEVIPAEQTEPAAEENTMEEETENKKVKGRPKKKGRYGLLGLPHLLSTAVWLLLIVAIGLSAGRMIWMCATDVLAFGREPVTATVVIEEADSIDTIANKLKNAGLIEYTGLFKLYAKFSSAMEDIRPGTYTFNGNSEDAELIVYDYMALVSVMSPSSGLTVVEDLRIPEGATCAQIFQLLEDKGVCTVQELEEFVKGIDPTNPDAPSILKDYWFLDGVQWGDRYSLEGYLFPNTYDFYENDDPKRVIEKMLDGFNASFTEVMRDKLQKLEGYNIRDVVIIASMIEKETASETESFKISSVIYNRLNSKDPQYDYLNIDATIVYALGGKSELTSADLAIDHPYNTYKYKGLPPGAISNPSQNSLAAALDPEDTVDENGKSVKYYFYALDPETEEHHFSKTLEEHEAFLKSLKEGQ